MFRYVLAMFVAILGLSSAAMAQEVTATGNYKGQDFALSRRVEILRAALDATVQQVQRMSVCNGRGMIYVSGTATGVDADGCKDVGGTADCLRVFRWNIHDGRCSYGGLGVALHPNYQAQCNENLAKAYSPSQVPAGYVNMGVFEDHTYTTHTGVGRDGNGSGDTYYRGYYIDAYCKANGKNKGE